MSTVITFVSAFVLICLILSPYAMNGFWGDDALNSQVRAWSERTHGSVWDLSVAIFKEWIVNQGRLMAGFLNGYFLYIFSDLQSLRLAHCISVLVNIGMFSYILHYLGFKRNLILAWAILFTGLFQIQDALDPVAAFAFHYTSVAIQLFLPVILLLKWSSSQSTKYLVFAMLLWFWAMMYYEVNAIFLIIAVMFVLKFNSHRPTAIRRNMMIIAFPAIAYSLLSYYLRSHAVNPNYPGSSFGQFSLVPVTYIKQLTSSLPLSAYFLVQEYKSFSFFDFLHSGAQSPTIWGIFILGSSLFYMVSNKLREEVKEVAGRVEILIIAAAMLLLPPAISAISVRYQNEIRWGVGTLTIYYQYFGTALILLWILSRFSFQNRTSRIAIAFTIGLYLSFNTTLNLRTVKSIDAEYFRGPRELFISQARQGLFKDVRDGDIIEMTGVPHYVNANLIFEGSGKNVFVPNNPPPWFAATPAPEAQKFLLSRNASGQYELTKPPVAIPEVSAPVVTEELFVKFKPGPHIRQREFPVGIDRFEYTGTHIIAYGWAYDSIMSPESIHVVLWNDQKKYWIGKATGVSRPDVADTFNNPALVTSGFTGIFSVESVPDGAYQAGILLTKEDGVQLLRFFKTLYIQRPVEIVVRPFTQKYHEQPLRIIFDLLDESDKEVKLAGWAIMEDRDSKNCKIQVLFKAENGSVFASTVNPTLRNDVTAFFKNLRNFDNSGFDAAIPKEGLPAGKYQLGILISYPESPVDAAQFTDRYIEKHE